MTFETFKIYNRVIGVLHKAMKILPLIEPSAGTSLATEQWAVHARQEGNVTVVTIYLEKAEDGEV